MNEDNNERSNLQPLVAQILALAQEFNVLLAAHASLPIHLQTQAMTRDALDMLAKGLKLDTLMTEWRKLAKKAGRRGDKSALRDYEFVVGTAQDADLVSFGAVAIGVTLHTSVGENTRR